MPPGNVSSETTHCCENSNCISSDHHEESNSFGTRAQVDDGSNANTTNQRRLLWNIQELSEPRYLHDAGGRRHRALGQGFLMVPASNPSGVEAILSLFTPTIEATIISPGGTCRQKRRNYNAHSVETNHDSGQSRMILRNRIRGSQDLVIECVLQQGLSFTDPLIAPTVAQRASPLKKATLHARYLNVDELDTRDALFDQDDLFDVPHGMDVDDLVNDVILEPEDIRAAVKAVNTPDDTQDKLITQERQPPELLVLDGESTISTVPSASPPIRMDDADNRLLFINHLNRDALRILWHQRLGHIHSRRVADMHKYAIGVPELPIASAADQCPTCMAAKMRKSARGQEDSRKATQCYQGLSIDFGFVVQSSKNTKRYRVNLGFNYETCYVVISDHYSGVLFGKAFKSKAPPIEYFHRWLSAFSPNCHDKYVRFDQGGELGRSAVVKGTFSKFDYDIQLTGADASHQNGPAERPHQAIGNAMRALLKGASLPAVYWPYAFYHFLRLSNCTIHDGKEHTPFEICSGRPTFGC